MLSAGLQQLRAWAERYSKRLLIKLSNFYDVSVDYILGISDVPKYKDKNELITVTLVGILAYYLNKALYVYLMKEKSCNKTFVKRLDKPLLLWYNR